MFRTGPPRISRELLPQNDQSCIPLESSKLLALSHTDAGTRKNESFPGESQLPVCRQNLRFTLDKPPSQYKYRNEQQVQIVHTLYTRFMVGQPGYPVLAQARYLQWETFCFPSVYHQSSQNFYWLIVADPRLPQTILSNMKDKVKPMDNAYLIFTSNTTWVEDGSDLPNSTGYGVDIYEIARLYSNRNVSIITGNTSRLLELDDSTRTSTTANNKHDSQKKENSIMVKIETLLDADDGLHTRAMEWIQEKAMDYFDDTYYNPKHKTSLSTFATKTATSSASFLDLNSTWWVLCATDHIEWHNREIFKTTPEEYHVKGIGSGVTGVRHAATFCTSASFTRVGYLGFIRTDELGQQQSLNNISVIRQFPKVALQNHAFALGLPYCGRNGTMAYCYRREFPDVPLALRSRGITSDSMDHLNPSQDDYRDNFWQKAKECPLLVNESEKTWRILERDFIVDRLKAWETSKYMIENVDGILAENFASQCAPGFPCKEYTMKNLKKLANVVQRRNETDRLRLRKMQLLHTRASNKRT